MSIKTFLSTLILFVALCFSPFTLAWHNNINPNNENIHCKVVGVLDGDTIQCLIDTPQRKQNIRIRLASIDAPEKSQSYGNKSKQFLSSLIFKKEIIASIESKDKYGRYIAELFLPNEAYSINYLMVKEGLAWNYARYSKDLGYQKAMEQAQKKKLNIWSEKNPINPEEFRKLK